MSGSRGEPAEESFSSVADTKRLKHRVRSGTRTALVAQVASQVVSFGVLACLYRQLAPDDFGLIGMVLPVLLLLRNLSTMGLNVVTIQRREITAGQLSSVFWLNILLGAVAAAVAAGLAPLVARLYGGRQELTLLTLALAGTSVAAAFGAQHQALLERRMRWTWLAATRLMAQLAAGAAAVSAALAGWGVWSLVVQQYVELLALASLFWYAEPWRPSGPRRGAAVTDLLALGGFFSAANLMSFLTTNVDKVLVGAAFGPRALGLYSQAFNLMMKPGYLLTTPLAGIMLPTLSRAAGQPAAYRELLVSFSRVISVILFPAAAGLFVVAPEVMLLLGGPRWSASGGMLSALALALFVQGFVNVAAYVFASAGRTARLLAGAGVLAGAMSAVTAAAVWYGRWRHLPVEQAVTLVAYGYSLGLTVLAVGYLAYCMRSVGLTAWTWSAPAARPLLAAVAMSAVVWGGRGWLLSMGTTSPAVTLALLVATGGIVYTALAWPDVRWLHRQAREFPLADNT